MQIHKLIYFTIYNSVVIKQNDGCLLYFSLYKSAYQVRDGQYSAIYMDVKLVYLYRESSVEGTSITHFVMSYFSCAVYMCIFLRDAIFSAKHGRGNVLFIYWSDMAYHYIALAVYN